MVYTNSHHEVFQLLLKPRALLIKTEKKPRTENVSFVKSAKTCRGEARVLFCHFLQISWSRLPLATALLMDSKTFAGAILYCDILTHTMQIICFSRVNCVFRLQASIVNSKSPITEKCSKHTKVQSISSFRKDPSIPKRSACSFGDPRLRFSSDLYFVWWSEGSVFCFKKTLKR